jgi:hypothetical protein
MQNKYNFINYYSSGYLSLQQKKPLIKLNDGEIDILATFLQRFQVTVECQLSDNCFKTFKNVPVASLDRPIFEKYFNSIGERYLTHEIKMDKMNYYINYKITDDKFLNGEDENGPCNIIISRNVPLNNKQITAQLTKISFKKMFVKLNVMNDLIWVDGEIKVEQFDEKTEKYFEK